MIQYNMRYRGPFEYDKFCLNVLQFCNEVAFLKQYELNDQEHSILTLHQLIDDYLTSFEKDYIDSLYQQIILLPKEG